MTNRTVFGTLLTAFRSKKYEARKQAEADLWRENKLTNPTKRDGHEIHESSIQNSDGSALVVVQLWKKIGEKRVKISVDVKSNEVQVVDEEVAALMK